MGNALPGLAVAAVLSVATDGCAESDCDSRVVLQLFQGQVEASVLHRLYKQLIDHCPNHGSCSTEDVSIAKEIGLYIMYPWL